MKIGNLDIHLAKPDPPPEERRNGERIPTHETLYLDYRSRFYFYLKQGVGKGEDLSISGIRFASDTPFPVGTPLVLTLHFYPGYQFAKSLQVQGHVVRCYRNPDQQHYRIACAFENVETFSAVELQAFISWLKAWNKNHPWQRPKNPQR